MTSTSKTPYDDVFRTLLERCSKLIIPVINEIFKTDYSMDEEIILVSNEHYIIEGVGDNVKRITDSCIKVAKRLYHIECESNPQTGMEIRMMEYDFHIALSGWKREEDIAVLRFPESAVLFLRHNSNSPDELKVKLIMPDGKEVIICVIYDMTEDGHEYLLQIGYDNTFDIIFGNDVYGKRLTEGDTVTIDYLTHSGSLGNVSSSGTTNFIFNQYGLDSLNNEVNINDYMKLEMK